MVKAMCGVQLKDRKRSMDLMFMLYLNEIIDQLAMTNFREWYLILRLKVKVRNGGHGKGG